MTSIGQQAADVFRDYEPGTQTPHQPVMAEIRGLFSAVDTAIDRATDSEAAGRAAADQAEATARVAGDRALPLPPALSGRPGDAPINFTAQRGDGEAELPPLDGSTIVSGDAGCVSRVIGAGVRAARWLYAIEPGRSYAAVFVVQRRINTSDPSNDAVRLAIDWHGQDKRGLGQRAVVSDLNDLVVASGRTVVRAIVARQASDGVTVVAPVAAAYARPHVECFGGSGVTDVEVIAWVDVTDAGAPLNVSALNDRLTMIEALSAGSRLSALESSSSSPKRWTILALSGIGSETIPPTVTLVEALTSTSASGGGVLLVRDVAGAYQSSDGARWTRIFTVGAWGVDARATPRASGASDTAFASVLEASSGSAYVDLGGMSLTTTLTITALSQRYHNGALWGVSQFGTTILAEPRAPIEDHAIQRDYDTAPPVDWSRAISVLWTGTSVTVEGLGQTPLRTNGSYPEIVGEQLGCSVINAGFAGSHVYFPPILIAGAQSVTEGLAYIKSLSMTADDVAAGLASLGAASPYSSTYDPSGITQAGQMTADARIKPRFAAGDVHVVVMHDLVNDRGQPLGTLTPPVVTITAIALGATTTLTLASTAGINIGSFIGCRISGIPRADYLSGRVQSVSGNTITLNIASSDWTGAFVSGSAVVLDRATIYGAIEAVCYLTLSYAAQYQRVMPYLVFTTPASRYFGGSYDPCVYSVARASEAASRKWGGYFFDLLRAYNVSARQHMALFPDSKHPSPAPTRRQIANLNVAWFCGGSVNRYPVTTVMLRDSASSPLIDGLTPIYDDAAAGFVTKETFEGTPIVALSETWGSGLGSYTTGGTAPTIIAAPWDATRYALKASAASGATSYVTRTGFTLDKSVIADFYIWLDAVEGLTTTTTPKTVDLFNLKTPAAYLGVQAIIRPAGVNLKAICFQEANAGLVSVTSTVMLKAATKHRVTLKARRQTASATGAIALYLDDVLIAGPLTVADSAQTTPTTMELGIRSSNTGAALTLYIGDTTLQKRPMYQLYSGSYPLPSDAIVANGRVVRPA